MNKESGFAFRETHEGVVTLIHISVVTNYDCCQLIAANWQLFCHNIFNTRSKIYCHCCDSDLISHHFFLSTPFNLQCHHYIHPCINSVLCVLTNQYWTGLDCVSFIKTQLREIISQKITTCLGLKRFMTEWRQINILLVIKSINNLLLSSCWH